MNRREFLEKTALVPPLAGVGAGELQTEGDTDRDTTDRDTPETVFSSVELHTSTFDTEFSVRAYPEDPTSDVGVSFGSGAAHIMLELTGAEVEHFADELLSAKREAES